METPYVAFQEQTDARIELAKSWQEKGFYFFATSTILQAYDAVDRFEKRLDGLGRRFFSYYFPCDLDKFCEAIEKTEFFSRASRMNLCGALEG